MCPFAPSCRKTITRVPVFVGNVAFKGNGMFDQAVRALVLPRGVTEYATEVWVSCRPRFSPRLTLLSVDSAASTQYKVSARECATAGSLDVCIISCLSMPKIDSLQGSLDLLVLKLLSRRPRLHGYAIMSAIRDTSEEVLRVEEGSLYPALHRMEESGWVRAEWVSKENGRRARVYELTAAGRKQLGAEESRWQAVTSAVNRVLRMA